MQAKKPQQAVTHFYIAAQQAQGTALVYSTHLLPRD
jgi:hypothetical protein